MILFLQFFLSQGVVYFCNNPFVSLFYRIVVPSIASNRKMMLDLDFCAGTDFCCSPFYFCKITETLFKSEIFVRDPQICTHLSLVLRFSIGAT